MKALMSINQKFMEYSPKELITLIKEKSKYTAGFEIYIDFNNSNHLLYLHELVFQCKKNNLYLQIHGNSKLSIDKQLEFMNLLENISDDLGYRISVVLHSLPANSLEESINLTTEYLNELTKKIDNNKIILSLENLNDEPKKIV